MYIGCFDSTIAHSPDELRNLLVGPSSWHAMSHKNIGFPAKTVMFPVYHDLRQTSGQNFWWNSSMSTMWRLSDTLWELGSSQFLKQYTDVYSIYTYIYIFIFISESAVQLTDMVGSEFFVGAKDKAFTVFCTSATGRVHIISWAQTLLLLNVSPSPAFQSVISYIFIRLSQWSE